MVPLTHDNLPCVADPSQHPVKLVIVTGSGRSGTSSVAGTLKRLGLHIPQPEVAADERNPRGYYESRWVADFHKHLLNPLPVRTIDSRPEAADLAMAATTPEVEAELREWLKDQLDHPLLVIKETRAYWVYAMWLHIAADLGLEVTSLTMLRHPTQVVRSRESAYLSGETEKFRRQRETTNVAAWMNSVFETERVTGGNPRAFVPYDDLISDWRAAMTRAGEQLGIEYVGDLTAPHPVDDFITPSLNRSAAVWDGLMVAPALIDLAERTWTAANVLVASPHDADSMAELERLRSEYVEMYESAAAFALDETTAQVAAVRRTMKARLVAKQERIDKLRAEVKKLRNR